MPLPASLHAYQEEMDAFAKAATTPLGIRVPRANESQARHFLHRLNKARVLDRESNARVLGKDSPLWNRSEYDVMSCIIRQVDGRWWVYIIQNPPELLDYEVLEYGPPDPPELERPAEPKQIPWRRL